MTIGSKQKSYSKSKNVKKMSNKLKIFSLKIQIILSAVSYERKDIIFYEKDFGFTISATGNFTFKIVNGRVVWGYLSRKNKP